MNKQCVNCPRSTDHTTAECPVMVEASAPIDPIHSAMMLGMTPEPCEPIIEITRQALTKLLDVVEFGDQLERVEKDRLVAFVKEILAEAQPELWAMHSVGPNEVHPMISKEEAEKQAASLIAPCKERFPEIPITVNVIPSPYSPFEHFEILAEELTEQVASLREALDKKNAEAAAPAVVNQQVTTAATCNHEWTDDGQHLLVCTACGAQEDHDPRWRDMATAPRDGTMVRLLVEFTEHATEDADQAPTIGANNFENDGEDRWQFAGWCWSHDHFTQGKGEPIGWLPMLDEPRRIAASNDNAPWSPSGIDYDRSIHSNPDAKAWADMFVTTFPGLADKHELMIGWFANAMMAMHDFLKAQLSGAASDVLAERRRQIEAEGMTTAGDDGYHAAELPRAAAAYILNGSNDEAPCIWPLAKAWWKPRDARSNYVRAGALILAEIERLDRAEQAKQQELQP